MAIYSLKMLENQIILCLGYGSWMSRRTDYHWMILLAKSNIVVFVEQQQKYESLRELGMSRRAYLRLFARQKPQWINDQLVVIRIPPYLPLGIPFVSRRFHSQVFSISVQLSKLVARQYIKNTLDNLGIAPSILWFHEPFDCHLIGHFGEKISCYRVFDEVALFPWWARVRNTLEKWDANCVKKANFVFASSFAQYEKRKLLNPNTFPVPNAVDFEHFHKAITASYERPCDMEGILSPIIGFTGIIDYRFDFGLIKELATSHPEWSVVVIGAVREDLRERAQEMATLTNMHFLGDKSIDVLPQYLHFFDVAIVPYHVNPSTSTMYPWKLQMYLAAGLSVVSTNLTEMRRFEPVVRIASSPQEFIGAIQEALTTNSPEQVEQRVSIARKNTWDQRVADISRLLSSAFAERTPESRAERKEE